MNRDRLHDTDPAPPLPMAKDAAGRGCDRTDPGIPPTVAGGELLPLTTEDDMLQAERLIGAFKRAPQRPVPSSSERAQSDGGNAVTYTASARVAPGQRALDEREKVLVQLAAFARHPADERASDLAATVGARALAPPLATGRRATRVGSSLALWSAGLGAAVVASAVLLVVRSASVRASVARAQSATPPAITGAPAPGSFASGAPASAGRATASAVGALESVASPRAAAEGGDAPARSSEKKAAPPRDHRSNARMTPPAPAAIKTPSKDQFWE